MEAALKQAGSCGLYQVIHVALTQAPRFATAWATFLMILGGYDPGWTCSQGTTPRHNFSTATITAGNNQPFNVDHTSSHGYNNLSNKNVIMPDNAVAHTRIFNQTCDEADYCGSDSVQFNPESITVVTEFQLICDMAWVVKFLIMLRGIGGFFGSFVAGQVGELYGRKTGLYLFIFLESVFSSVAIFSPHWIMYAVCTFFINFGCQGTITLANVFSMELLNSKWRGYFGGIPVWPVSMLIYTFIISVLRNWVYLHIATSVLALAACAGFFVLPESPRWLMVHGKREDVKKCILKIAKYNRKPEPSFDEDGSDFDHLEPAVDSDETIKRKNTYLDVFRTKEMRVYSLKLFLLMALYNLCYVGLSFGIQSLPGDFYTNIIISSCIDIGILLLCGLLTNRIGRRWAGVSLATAGIVCCLSIVLVSLTLGHTSEYASTVIKVSTFIAKSGVLGIFNVGQVFVVELFPTEVRNLAQGLARSAVGVGALLSPLIIPTKAHDLSFIVIFSILCVSFSIHFGIFLSLPETNKRNLMDILPGRRKQPEINDHDDDGAATGPRL